jgi:Leucine-rich repeat (LRR) protein
MKKLQVLEVANNQISIIQKKEFHNMSTLISIDLRNNNLYKLDLDLVQGCSKLKKLCLNGNKLSYNNFSLNFDGLYSLDSDSIWNENCSTED